MKIIEYYRKRSIKQTARELTHKAYLWAQENFTTADQATVTHFQKLVSAYSREKLVFSSCLHLENKEIYKKHFW